MMPLRHRALADAGSGSRPSAAPGARGRWPARGWLAGQADGLLTVYFGAPSMFITLWFGFDYGTNPPLGTLII
jgi:hypothetical protein